MNTVVDMFSLAGKRVVITGGAGGIGTRVAETVVDLGGRVVITDMDSLALEEASRKLKARNKDCSVETVVCDLENENERTELGEKVLSANAQVDVFIHCAGLVGSTTLEGWTTQFEQQSLNTWRRAIEVNISSAFHLCQIFSPSLTETKGSIVFFSSIYGVLGPDYSLYESTGMGNPAAYAASKGGLIQFTRWLATTLAPAVNVNCVSPGGVARDQDEAFVKKYTRKTPLGRMATEDDFSGVVALLSTDAGSYITGQNIMVDGGWSVW